jgi:hypothetical protein
LITGRDPDENAIGQGETVWNLTVRDGADLADWLKFSGWGGQ